MDISLQSNDNVNESWEIQCIELSTGIEERNRYGAVIVASGHHSTPRVPELSGMDDWLSMHPDSIIHSKTRSVHESLTLRPKILRLIPSGRAVEFEDGSTATEIDLIILCTGYVYSLPFLRTINPALIQSGDMVTNLYEHVFYVPRPTLSFIGLPRVPSFAILEAQAVVVARTYSGRLPFLSGDAMRGWETARKNECIQLSKFHHYPYPHDAEYFEMLLKWASHATGRSDVDEGKLPRVWSAKDHDLRRNSSAIRASFRFPSKTENEQ